MQLLQAGLAVVVAISIGVGGAVRAQVAPQHSSATMLAEPPVPLLGPLLGGVIRTGDATTAEGAGCAALIAPATAGPAPDAQLTAALQEDGITRCSAATYKAGSLPLRAAQFKDVTGAMAACSLFHCGEGGVTQAQTVVVFAPKNAEPSEVKAIVSALPKVSGAAALPPLLPTLLPAKNRTAGSQRYAVGAAGFAASGLGFGAAAVDPSSLGWEKYGEAAGATYRGGGGEEHLVLLLYPTPVIAAAHAKALEDAAAGKPLQVKRDRELVMAASGAWSAADAAAFLGNIHLREEATFDKAMPPSFTAEVTKTYSLLSTIVVGTGVLALAAVLMAIFLGGGRAMLRKLRGKDAATEAEFLSLHLDPQNAPVKFAPGPTER